MAARERGGEWEVGEAIFNFSHFFFCSKSVAEGWLCTRVPVPCENTKIDSSKQRT